MAGGVAGGASGAAGGATSGAAGATVVVGAAGDVAVGVSAAGGVAGGAGAGAAGAAAGAVAGVGVAGAGRAGAGWANAFPSVRRTVAPMSEVVRRVTSMTSGFCCGAKDYESVTFQRLHRDQWENRVTFMTLRAPNGNESETTGRPARGMLR